MRARWSRTTRRSRYEPVIGLEVHVELGTTTKMFCGCPTTFGAEPNTQVCPVCLGLPGSLPVVNRTAIEYDDPDRPGAELLDRVVVPVRPEELLLPGHAEELPDLPVRRADVHRRLARRPRSDGETVRVEIERVHMEEDTGKSLHVGGATGRIHGADYSLVDYNRAGIPLVEIVTKPVAGHRRARARRSRAPTSRAARPGAARWASPTCGWSRARCAATSTCRWRRAGAAVGHPHRDQERQLAALGRARGALRDRAAGGACWTPAAGSSRRPGTSTRTPATTTSGRSKEEAEDYRYFPEPDLVPVAPAPDWVEELRGGACPSSRRAPRRLQAEWGITDFDMRALVNAGALDLVEATVAAGASPADARKWWLGELARPRQRGRRRARRPADHPGAGRPGRGAGRRRRAERQAGARRSSTGCWPARASPDEVIAAAAWRSSRDDGALDGRHRRGDRGPARRRGQDPRRQGRRGGALVGAVMKATRGQADAARVRELMLERLS